MINPFATITYQQAQQAVLSEALLPSSQRAYAQGLSTAIVPFIPFEMSPMATGVGIQNQAHGWAAYDWLDSNTAFFLGDHWQNGLGWVGPRPSPTDPQGYLALITLARLFVFKNVVREIVRRHVGGVLGRAPDWEVTLIRALADDEQPTPEEQALLDEAQSALRAWWDKRGLHELLQEAAGKACYAERGPLRLYIPEGERDESGNVSAKTLDDALDLIYAESPGPKQLAVVDDPKTKRQAGLYVAAHSPAAWDVGGTLEYAEVTYVDQATGNTVVRCLDNTGDKEEPMELMLGGRLMHAEIKRPLIITMSVRTQQRQLNLSKTMMSRNVIMGGFLERTLLDVQLPGEYVIEKRADGTEAQRFKADPINVGAGTVNAFEGKEYKNEDGSFTRATPQVVYRDPVKPDAFTLTEESAYESMLEECQQIYALISGDATSSGVSRETARQEFEADLMVTAASANRSGRWVLETPLALAGEFMGKPGRYDGLRVNFNCRIDVGARDSSQRGEDRASVQAGLMARATAMGLSGIEDTDAEKGLIESEESASLTTLQTKAVIAQTLVLANADPEEAAIVAGFDPKDAKKLFPEPPPEPAPADGKPAGDAAPIVGGEPNADEQQQDS